MSLFHDVPEPSELASAEFMGLLWGRALRLWSAHWSRSASESSERHSWARRASAANSVPVPVSWTNRRPNHAAFRVSS